MNTEDNVVYEIIGASEATNVRFCTLEVHGNYVPKHWHRAIEIMYELEGEQTVLMDGKSYALSAGRCIVINANVIHETRSTQSERFILLQIPLEFIEKYIPNIYQLNFLLNDADGAAGSLPQKKSKVFKHILRKMKELDDNKPEGFLLYFNQLLFKLMCMLHHNFCDKMYHTDGGQRKKELMRLNTILAYIMQNYTRVISVEEIAKVAAFQPKYFCRFFKKHMGITFKEYQSELRLSYIYRDLLNTNDSVASILERHGFNNYKLFRRMFKEHFNDTPMGMRKKLNEASNLEA